MCENPLTPTSMSEFVSGSGSYKQFPNPNEKVSITDQQSPHRGIKLKTILDVCLGVQVVYFCKLDVFHDTLDISLYLYSTLSCILTH